MTFNLRELDVILANLEATIEMKRGLAVYFGSKGKNRHAEALNSEIAELQLLKQKFSQKLIAQTFSETLPKA